MLKGERVLLRAGTREDMKRQWESENNIDLWFYDGDTPRPSSMEALLAHYDSKVNEKNPSSISFSIDVDGLYIGHCGLHQFNETARHCILSVEIGDSDYWG